MDCSHTEVDIFCLCEALKVWACGDGVGQQLRTVYESSAYLSNGLLPPGLPSKREFMINSLSLKILFLYGNLQIKFEDLSTFKGFQISLKPRLFCLLYFDLLSYCMTYTCVYVYMYSRPRLYVCVFTRICMYMYVHIHACTCRFILV